MAKAKRLKKVGWLATEEGGRKSLPRLAFEELARQRVRSLASRRPPGFGPEDLVREINSFLDHAGKKIRLPWGHIGLSIDAIQIEGYLRAPFLGRDCELLEQDDFKRWAQPLLEDENFQVLYEDIRLLGKEAARLHLKWSVAEGIIRNIAEEVRPDRRPERVKRGEFCECILAELKEIRRHHTEFRTVDELERVLPNLQVVQMLKSGPFDSEDCDLLAHPNQWESPVVHAYGLLKKRFLVNSDHTIDKYRKEFKTFLKSSRSLAHRKRRR